MVGRDDDYLRAMSKGLTWRGFPEVEAYVNSDYVTSLGLGQVLGKLWAAQFPFKHDNDPSEFARLLGHVLRDLSAKESVIHDSLPEHEKRRPKFDDPDLYEERALATEEFLEGFAGGSGLQYFKIAQIYSQAASDNTLPGYIGQGLKIEALDQYEMDRYKRAVDECVNRFMNGIYTGIDLEEFYRFTPQIRLIVACIVSSLPPEQRPNLFAVQIGEGSCTIAVTQNHRSALTGPGVITVIPGELKTEKIADLLASSDRPLILITGDSEASSDQLSTYAERIRTTMTEQGRQFTIEPYETLYPTPATPTPHPTIPGTPSTPKPPHGQLGPNNPGTPPLRPN